MPNSARETPASQPRRAQPYRPVELAPDAVSYINERPAPGVIISGNREWLAVCIPRRFLRLSELAHTEFFTDDLRIDIRNTVPDRWPRIESLKIFRVSDHTSRIIPADPETSFYPLGFSADGDYFSFASIRGDGLYLGWLECASGDTRLVTSQRLNGFCSYLGQPVASWAGQQRRMVCRFVADTVMPTNLQHLRQDESIPLLRECLRSQLAIVDVPAGVIEYIETPDLFGQLNASPSGEYLFLQRIALPSGSGAGHVQHSKYPEIYSIPDAEVKTRLSGDSIGSGAEGIDRNRRCWKWHPLEPAVMTWVEKCNSGEEIIVSLPDLHHPETLVALESDLIGCIGFDWTTDGSLLVRQRYPQKGVCLSVCGGLSGKERRCLLVETRCPAFDEGRCDAPGRLATPMVTSVFGHCVVVEHMRSIYVQATVPMSTGPLPILERIDLDSGVRTRVFESEPSVHETVVALLRDDGERLITLREGPLAPARLRLYDRRLNEGSWLDADDVRCSAISRSVRRQLRYHHADGRALGATAYLPHRGDKCARPFLVWLYPITSENTYRPFAPAQNQFLRLADSSALPLVAAGYGVVDSPDMSLDFSSEQVLDDLVGSTASLVESLVEAGVADARRIAIGGYCFGAWAAALLLAHTRLFCAGIVCSGAYDVNSWPLDSTMAGRHGVRQSKDWVQKVSPISVADRIQVPLLVIEGEHEAKPSPITVGMQLYSIIAEGGGTAQYVRLPHEGHWYAAAESHIRIHAEIQQWCDTHVKPSRRQVVA